MPDRAARSVTAGSLRRAYLPESAGPDGRATLDPDESHHVSRVLRLRAGDALAVFDGRGREWEAVVAEVGRDRVVIVPGAPRETVPEPRTRVTIAQAFIRPEKLEWVLEKGTEIGVAAFRLVPSRRGTTDPPSPSRLARYRRIVLEACKQSGRSLLPDLAASTLTDLPREGSRLVLDPRARLAVGEVLDPGEGEVCLAVGPEGGFDEEEIAGLVASGFRAASLGPRTLRTETAGAVAAAIVLYLRGDLGGTGRI